MQYQELTPEEQAKVRRFLRDELPGTYRRVADVVAGRGAAIDDAELLAQLRALWTQHRNVLSSDFTLPDASVRRVERDRCAYLAPDEALGPLPDPGATDPGRLVRRIHHQRIALRQLEMLHAGMLRHQAQDVRRTRRWEEAEARMVSEDLLAADADADAADSGPAGPADQARLRSKVRRQRHALRRAHRLIDAQQAEMGRLVDKLVRAAATG